MTRPPAKKATSSRAEGLLPGRATPEGTRAFSQRFAHLFSPDFYRTVGNLTVSSIGMGTYLGECDDEEDARYVTVLREGAANGLNLLDTAINYRCQRSERAVGLAIRELIASGQADREELVVCTKGGYVPLEGSPPESRQEYDSYLEQEYFSRGTMRRSDLVAGGHCLTPRFLSNQIQRSRTNLGIECIDVFYIHNPEQQLDTVDRAGFLKSMTEAFASLEEQAHEGRIASYGCATWNGFRSFAAKKNHLSLRELVDAAIAAGGKGHHFRVVQLPVNLAMTEAVRSPTQEDQGKNVTLLELARELGISVVASATLMQAQLTQNLPAAVKSLFPAAETDAQRAISFVRSVGVASALIGMRSTDHLSENLRSAPAIAAS
jgi:aryl-alcohol dehydrogenase-like predicted oxidoreductase